MEASLQQLNTEHRETLVSTNGGNFQTLTICDKSEPPCVGEDEK